MTRRLFVLACSGIALALAPLGAAQAETPVLTGPDSSWSTSGSIADPHVQVTCAVDPSDPLPVAEAACPTFPITLDAPDDRPLHYLDARLDFGAATFAGRRSVEDYDLYVYDANGNEVANAASALGSFEIASANLIADGTYTIVVVPYTNLPDSPFTLSVRYRTFVN